MMFYFIVFSQDKESGFIFATIWLCKSLGMVAFFGAMTVSSIFDNIGLGFCTGSIIQTWALTFYNQSGARVLENKTSIRLQALCEVTAFCFAR